MARDTLCEESRWAIRKRRGQGYRARGSTSEVVNDFNVVSKTKNDNGNTTQTPSPFALMVRSSLARPNPGRRQSPGPSEGTIKKPHSTTRPPAVIQVQPDPRRPPPIQMPQILGDKNIPTVWCGPPVLNTQDCPTPIIRSALQNTFTDISSLSPRDSISLDADLG